MNYLKELVVFINFQLERILIYISDKKVEIPIINLYLSNYDYCGIIKTN